MARLTKQTVVAVLWYDTWGATSGWTDVDAIDKGYCYVTTVGILLKNHNRGHVTVLQSWTDSDAVDNVIHIPDVNVISITEVGRCEIH